MSGYQIGQYRFRDASLCASNLTGSSTVSYRTVSFDDDSSAMGAGSFKDVILHPQGGFEENQDYYVRVEIPQDLNFEQTFDIKLLKQEQGVDVYQYLARINIPLGGNSENIYTVVLYETREKEYYDDYDEDGDPIQKERYKLNAMIPLEYSVLNPTIRDAIYLKQVDGEPDEYYLGNGLDPVADGESKAYTKWEKYNDALIVASWKQESMKQTYVFEYIFRPVEAGFTDILLEMDRDATDLNTQITDTETGETIYGRILDIEFIREHFEIYRLIDLKQSMRAGELPLSKIGVWSHPELYMAINGEGIKIGPSGYYELDVLPIESLSIMARGPQDNFTVDYEYLIQDETTD